ncbi:MAG: Nif3-like dinuclear metal center hexameric protein [Candidatus Thorarchaeota archaeon]|jgi:putative NIF3 family GTP cyclohydrolase 1 type 2
MKAEKLYKSLKDEFEYDKYEREEWGFSDDDDYVTESFKKTGKGVVLDNTEEIQKVYTAVFPSEHVLDQLLSSGERNILLFTHHPVIWDTTIGGFPFRKIPSDYLENLRDCAISLCSIHAPLDRNGPYGTGTSLARAIQIEKESEFFEYEGVLVGIIGRSDCKTVTELTKRVSDVVGHRVKTWEYGTPEIANQKVAAIGGGGNFPEIAEQLAETDVRMYVTGVTRRVPDYEPSWKFHEICQEHGMSVIAATHYSTEKFACMAVLKFFETLEMPSEFVEDSPSFQDYE